ncbi:CHAT domain-containing protein [Bombardia bombarda]|uniref:CHAT domain-containing protein n=1 Tax=Bombardia bombarda TaxID=252184 RepID=A0AA39XIP9_9PEZI|nr:CHAT domain-containing protein [Bombardia bombarda]
MAGVDDTIDVLARAERVYDDVRRNRSVPLAHHYSITGKVQNLRKYNAGVLLYDQAICWNRIAWNIHLEAARKLHEEVIAAAQGTYSDAETNVARQASLAGLEIKWKESYAQFVSWTQKSKSRAIFDLLSIDSPIPLEQLEECNRDSSAAAMIKLERKLTQDLGRKLPDNVIFVDFIYVEFDRPLRAVCYRKGLTYFPTLMHDVSWDALTQWTKQLERPAKGVLGKADTGKASLALLTPILLPLFKIGNGSPNQDLGPVIRPDDTVVFCPTGILHKIPLHAIPIDGVPVIEKHPVVYCPSLTVLQHCLQMRSMMKLPNQHDSVSAARLVVNPMPTHWDMANTELVESTPNMELLSRALSARYIHGWNLEKRLVLDNLSGVVNFHYHGHIQYVKGSGLESYLKLGQPKEKRDEEEEDADDSSEPELNEKRLTANDLFSCRLAKGALVTLVGCNSGGADVSAANDVLELPMALYYAGAASTVSSLWKLDDVNGSMWAEAFYGDLMEQAGRDSGEHGIGEGISPGAPRTDDLVNLAVAMQKAVTRLRFDDAGQ